MTSRPSILIPAAACFALCAFAFANVALAEDAPKADAMTADHMSSDHMAPMKKHHMKKHMMKERRNVVRPYGARSAKVIAAPRTRGRLRQSRRGRPRWFKSVGGA